MIDKSKLLAKKHYGDISVVARMLNTTPSNVMQMLRRETSKRHDEAVEALSKVIEARDRLIKQ